MRTKLFIPLLMVMIAAPLTAAAISDTYVIPAAAHTRGAGGELWLSDVQLFNPNGIPLNVDALFIDANGTARALGTTVTIAPNATALMRDAVGTAGGQGAIVLAANLPFVVGSRAYATTSGGTYGESVAPVAEFIDEASGEAFLTGLTSSSTARTNIGVFAAADRDQPMSVTITLLDGSGATAGTRTLTIPAGAMSAVQMPVGTIAAGVLDGASARVRISAGSGVATAYASVIDNATSDSTFMTASSGVLPPGQAAAKLRSHFE